MLCFGLGAQAVGVPTWSDEVGQAVIPICWLRALLLSDELGEKGLGLTHAPHIARHGVCLNLMVSVFLLVAIWSVLDAIWLVMCKCP